MYHADRWNTVIYTLYDIACRAEASSDQSSRALFAAYGEVLEEQGLQPSDDAVLHRFLFRMQKSRRQDEGLVERLRRVLKESFDIDIEVDEDGEGIEVTTNLDATRDGAHASLGRYSRRGSFDSFFDATADKIAGTEHGDLPSRTRRGSQRNAPNGDGRQWKQRRATSDTEARSYQHAQLPVRNRPNGIRQRSYSQQHTGNHTRNASISSRGSLQIRRNDAMENAYPGDNDATSSDFTDRTTSVDLSHVQIPGVNVPIPRAQNESSNQYDPFMPEPYRPSDTRLLDEAATFEEQRLHRVTRKCIQRWRERAQQSMSRRELMGQQATAFDRRILIRLSFEQLQGTARMRRSSRETNRFFERLETRADRARNLFLLTKAFTHWARSAEDEVQRTSVARRHILRTRFFNGWRDITVVNELKIQHFVLGKFLRNWRARSAAIREQTQYAISSYENNLVHKVYKEWFFHWCAIAAPAWRNDRIRRVTLQKWSEIAKVLREREAWAVGRRDGIVLQQQWQRWQERSTVVQSQQPQADQFRHNALISSALRTLQKEAKLRPLLQQFKERTSVRLIRDVFAAWRKNATQSRQARSVDCMRVLRNAYTAWNDRLRIKALEDRINDRVIVESLYKWTLASRVSLFQRVHNRQLKENTFLTWVTKTNQRTNSLDAAERRFARFKRTQLLRSCLRTMEAVTTEKRAEEFAVKMNYEQKLKQKIFDRLKERQEHFQQLNQWSADAQFYILSKRTLKTWSEATQHSRRTRRRDTYSQVRRTVKVNLVRRVFEQWRDRSLQITAQSEQAKNMHDSHVLQICGASLHHWHNRAISVTQLNAQASNVYNFRLGARCLRTWTSRLEDMQNLDNQAAALRQESIEIVATSALKKLGWRLWNIQRQEENARALHGRNFEKHVRAMLRFWLEQANEKFANRPASPTPTSKSRSRRRDHENATFQGGEPHAKQPDPNAVGENDENPEALEPWTAFDESALNLDNDNELDLSLSVTPDRLNQANLYPIPPPTSSPPPIRPQSTARNLPVRPNTYPQPQSILRRPPQPAPSQILEEEDDDEEFGGGGPGNETFWSGTPAIPPPTHLRNPPSLLPTLGKPGYLKTPSRRSVARAKRSELPASPERKGLSPFRRGGGVAGSMSAPPVRSGPGVGGSGGGVTSFERRLREGGFGFGGSVATGMAGRAAPTGRGTGRNRVGFGDVSEMG